MARIFQVMEKRPKYIRYFRGWELQERVSTVERFLDEIDEKNHLNRRSEFAMIRSDRSQQKRL